MGYPLPDETTAPPETPPAEDRTREEMVRTRALEAAAQGQAARGPGRSPWLLADLEKQEAFLQDVSRYFRSVESGEALSHAAEWLLDNFYLAQQSLRQIKEDMPRGYYKKLPKLVTGELAGYPRSYQIAQTLITENAGRLELDTLRQYVWYYQEAAALTTGELWSLPVMLRLSVLDILAEALQDITGLARTVDVPSAPIAPGLTNDEIVANCFTSLRAIANHDWRRFFEAVSRVEVTLRRDPPGIYAAMDSPTRDQYRKVVEDLAQSTGKSEEEVARLAVGLAGSAPATAPGQIRERAAQAETDWLAAQTGHVGYYLMGEGRTALEAEVGFHASPGLRLSRFAYRHPTGLYLGPILSLAVLLLVAALVVSRNSGATVGGQLLAVILSVVPALTVAVSAWDWFVTVRTPPRRLPKLNFETGIPTQFRTVVVVPSLLASASDIRSLMHQLEVSYLGNPDSNLSYALLTDFTDSSEQKTAGDDELLQRARDAIRELNSRYVRDRGTAFHLLHRERRWNAAENRWMGWERKRGKLHEFNIWLRGAEDTSYVAFEGDVGSLRGARYVITLDADTLLPRDNARRLIGTLAHPLNRAEADPETGRVVRGYGLLQPRTEITPASANYSAFSRTYAGDIGLDLYTNAVSNVYQDLFGSGIYVGKGIYDVDAFERSLEGRVPENTLLSHDLFEGIHARVGLVTDIVLYEDYPPTYMTYVRRLLRWTRGDWQLIPWLLACLPGTGRREVCRQYRAIDRWKVVDNLRRSLLPLSLLLLLCAGWLGWLGNYRIWAVAPLLVPGVPTILGALTPFLARPRRAPLRSAIRTLVGGGERWLLSLVFLPYEAVQITYAILLTLARVLVTRKRLLEWMTAAEAMRQLAKGHSRRRHLSLMSSSVVVGAAILLLLALFAPSGVLPALPLVLAWLVAPEVAYRISTPASRGPQPLTPDQLYQLRRLARRTWLFFEQFVGPEDHWLPPDHYQESPRGVAAPYTSPTNIGMLLLSSLAAYDLGYIGFQILVTRLQYTFETLTHLERYRGHFLNWYDTRTLEPLLPRYISTVDSGNLGACLVVLRTALAQIRRERVMRWERWEGLADTFSLLDDPIGDLRTAGLVRDAERLETVIAELQHRVLAVQEQPDAWWETLEYAAGEGWEQLNAALTHLIDTQGPHLGAETLRRMRLALERMRFQIFTMQRFVNLLLPWMPMRRETPPALLYDTYPEVSALYQRLLSTLDGNPRLAEAPSMCHSAQELVQKIADALGRIDGNRVELDEGLAWCATLSARLAEAASQAEQSLDGLRSLGEQADCYLMEMDFNFLFDRHRQVFHIGYNASAGRLDDNYYDLLASEARIASIVALAKHDVPRTHWLHLARPLTQVDGTRALLSWSATMFEYLMPRLMMRSTPGTLLYESEAAAVDHQIRYGARRGMPWGISESGYYALDASQNYQYRAFGVPGLGFKRHLAEDLVISPYSSVLALPYRPDAVLKNLRQLTEIGALGAHGFYEAVDFTKVRLDLGQSHAIVYEYMAHHQGMILVALANHLQGDRMVERFHADPRVGSVDMLLQEKVPNTAPLEFADEDEAPPVQRPERATAALPWSVSYTAPAPQVHYLSNGSYGVLISSTGAGFSRWGDIDLTRWRADTTLQDSGQWIYVQDLDEDTMWSAAYQPAAVKADNQSVYFYPHMAQFQRIDNEIGITTEILVAPDSDVEIRRVTMMNHSERPRRLALTSYAEVVMAAAAADGRHPAFNKLFIESDYVEELGALVFRRRPRSDTEQPVFVAHLATGEDGALLPRSYESDRAAFLGRGGSVRMPAELSIGSRGLGGGTGSTLDPVMALQCGIELGPGERKTLAFVTAAAGSRARLLELAAHYRSRAVIEQAFAESRARAALELGSLGLSTIELERMHALLSVLLYPHGALRATPSVLSSNSKGQSALWAYAISGDYPIMLARVRDESDIGLVQDLLEAQAYWRRRRLMMDLVILVDKEVGYSQELRDELHRLLAKMQVETKLNQRGGIFILYGPQMPEADRNLLLTTARVVLDLEQGPLPIQLEALRRQPSYLPAFSPERGEVFISQPERGVVRPAELRFDNGTGGFSPDGREYVIYLEPGQSSPAPWANVLANPEFGSIVSEAGSSCTWAVNSGENRLTPWMNDPVSDPSGEALYLRDEETGEVWSPTPQPSPAAAPYLVRHGQGSTTFEHESHGLSQLLQHVVPPSDPVKVVRLRLENNWSRTRRITATFYVEWVLGVAREAMQPYIIAEFDGATQALLARNPYNAEFGDRVAFIAASKELHGVTTDRTEFLGALGSRAQPAALGRIGLGGGPHPSGGAHVGLDPCAALQVHMDLGPGQAEEVWFVLGQGRDRDDAVRLAAEYRSPERAARAVDETPKFWDNLLGAVQVQTPDPAMDILLNRWLPYQALACRIWGRSALYQSSGAYGFRDQLQDVLAMIHAAPQVAREQILRAAEHQFEAGDVLHWWHPPSGRGVRTRYSDDLLWLPYVTTLYVEATGDAGILDETRPFLRATPLEPHEEERYGQYPVTAETYSLFEHCRRALERGSTAGQHGLPLMGGGDWNDGMNRVGIQGRGESVWLGWFLLATYKRWADLCDQRGETELAATHRNQAAALSESLEAHAWDGEWYLRAYYDDGSPLGSSQNNECQIDSIAQSWSVLSGSGRPERSARAMESVERLLVRQDDGLILLFSPPFDKTPRDPGYIKGYVPGIRENGGQYTHAALWTVWAFAELGDGQTATDLFSLLNPIYHSDTPEKVEQYKVEPYVIAADVYGIAPHTGRGGWTWYTGSSGWMYRLGLEGILGVRRQGNALRFEPRLAPRWDGYSVMYRFGAAVYRVRVHNRVRGQPVSRHRIIVDGNEIEGETLPLADDGREHDVQVWPDAGS